VEEQVKKVPENSSYYLLLGQLYGARRDFEKAEPALLKAVDLDKNNVDAAMFLAQAQIARGEKDRAMASYRQLLQQNPRDVRAYVSLGALEESLGKWQEAKGLYQKALAIAPHAPLAANNLAYCMLEHGGSIDRAVALAEDARRGAPESPAIADTLAWAYYHKGTYQPAIDLLVEALKKVPDDPNFHYHLGLAYQKANDKPRAREHLERALHLGPQSAHAEDIRKALAQIPQG